jgi:hypothetical protein
MEYDTEAGQSLYFNFGSLVVTNETLELGV